MFSRLYIMVITISIYTTMENVAKTFGNIHFCTDIMVHFKLVVFYHLIIEKVKYLAFSTNNKSSINLCIM